MWWHGGAAGSIVTSQLYGLILSLGYHLCGVSLFHILPMFFQLPRKNYGMPVGGLAAVHYP